MKIGEYCMTFFVPIFFLELIDLEYSLWLDQLTAAEFKIGIEFGPVPNSILLFLVDRPVQLV